MRPINLIVIHCSASDNKDHDDISVIDSWHKLRGFIRKRIPAGAANKQDKSVGYHFFIKKDGTIQTGRDLDEIGAHVEGHNLKSIGICFSGLNNFTDAQIVSGKSLIVKLLDQFKLETKDVLGHHDLFKGKLCPNMDYRTLLLSDLFH